VLTYKKRAT